MSVEHVTMTGWGRVTAVPDVARVRLGVWHAATDVATAVRTCSRSARAVIAALDAAGVAPGDRQTTGLEVNRGYDHREGTPSGFEVAQGLTLTVRANETLGDLVDACAVAAGDAFRLHGLGWSLQNAAEVRTQARDAAWADAREKALQVAGLAGRELGRVLFVAEAREHGAVWAKAASYEQEALEVGAMPVEAGESAITVGLEVRWELV